MRILAAICVVALLGLGGPVAQASPADGDVSGCVAAQLQASVTSFAGRVDNYKKHTHQYFTQFNLFVTNDGPGPCYLRGAPQVALRAGGKDVGGPYSREPSELSAQALLTPGSILLDPLLLPYAVSKQYAEIAGDWSAPFCGRPVRATMTVAFATAEVLPLGTIPSPPCDRRGGRRGTNTSSWWVR